MKIKGRIYISTLALFTTSTAILFLILNASQNNSVQPARLETILVMATAFCMVAIMHSYGFRHFQTVINSQEERIQRAEKDLEEMQHNHEATVEKRTFEISVVNASLNREIAERIQAETESKALQHRMHLILESAGEGIFGLDTKGNVTFVNKAAGLMVGWESDDLVGRSHHDIVHHTHSDGSNYPAADCPIYMTCRDGLVHFKSNDRFWAKDGSSFPVEYVSTPIIEDEKVTGAVVVFRDMNTFS